MVIGTLAKQSGVPAKTIRYYESIGLLALPKRAANNYRLYTAADVERLRLIASLRSLGCSLGDVAAILTARDQGIAPCQHVLDAIADQLHQIQRRMADLVALRAALQQLHQEGSILPLDDVSGQHCICALLKNYRESGEITLQKENAFDAGSLLLPST